MAIRIATATAHGPRVTYNEYLKGDEKKPHKICSVFPGDIFFANHNGSYHLQGCKDGQRYSYIEVNPGTEKYDLGEDKHLVNLSIPSKTIAEDYLGILAGNTDLTDRGLFVPEGDEPTDEELAEAHKRMRAFFEKQIETADREFSLRGQARFIDSNARLALKKLGLTRSWGDSYRPEETQDCPACKGPMRKGAAIHSANDRQGCGQKVAYDTAGEPFWPDAPMRPRAQQPAPARSGL